ncbi:MAG: antitoxin HicB [Synergistaceae bacterium]|nr:antitoxin HicB [Synergistaceae bacterium]
MKNERATAVYPAIFSHDDDGITITFPDLPGCISCAQTDEEALHMARDALGAWIVATEDLGEPVPPPSRASDLRPGPDEAVCLVDVWLPIFREERRAGSVKKNVTVPLWLNVLAERAGLNFSQVLQAGLKSVLGIQDR